MTTLESPQGNRQSHSVSPAGLSIGYDDFRRIMGSFASGISVVTSIGRDHRARGLTCSAVCSVSADPPLLLSCIRSPSATLDALRERGSFAVNFLDSLAHKVSDLFASPASDKFAEVQWQPGPMTEMPILSRTLAHAECTVHMVVAAGDHVVVLGRVVGGKAVPNRYPLGYWRGNYVQLQSADLEIGDIA